MKRHDPAIALSLTALFVVFVFTALAIAIH
jgi:hypothetical protein